MLAWRRAGIALVVVALALGLGGALAGAKKRHGKPTGQKWASQVTLNHPATTQFAGTVRSKLSACRDSRLVTLYYSDPTTLQTLPLSVQRTDKNGNYQVVLTKDAFAGTYQVQVSQQRIRAMKAPQTCKGAQSAIVAV
jgi:hypothetical protein